MTTRRTVGPWKLSRLARIALVVLAVFSVVSVVAETNVLARPGGGNTYSGPSTSDRSSSSSGSGTSGTTTSPSTGSTPSSGSSGSSSSSDSGDAELIGAIILILIELVIEHPILGVILLGIAAAIYIGVRIRDAWRGSSWATSTHRPSTTIEPPRQDRSALSPPRVPGQAGAPGPSAGAPLFGDTPLLGNTATIHKPSRRSFLLDTVRTKDPDFSLVLFEDFLYSLYAETHRARGGDGIDLLAPYLAPAARDALRRYHAAAVTTVVIGSMQFEQVWSPDRTPGVVQVVVMFDANYTEKDDAGIVRSWVTREQWTLERKVTATSRAPKQSHVFGCPNCGAPLTAIRGRTCDHCKQVVDSGSYDWYVVRIAVQDRSQRGSMLGGDTVEVGTYDPTVVDPDAEGAWRALAARDTQTTWPAMVERVRHVFKAFHEGWNAQDMMRARHVLSDHLFQGQTFWIDAYREAGLQNRTAEAEVVAVRPAHVLSDRHFDAVTVRVFATGMDYTVDATGKVVGGSKTAPRAYSEYWTLIRSKDRKGPPGLKDSCPNCGGPLAITMAGHCEHCKVRVTSGAFDWVLSRIEQDESYQG